MTESWAVLVIDWVGDKHIVKINADNVPSAIAAVEENFDKPVTVKRCKRIFREIDIDLVH